MTKRDEIRNYLRFEAGGASVRRIATAVDETYDKVDSHLRNMAKRGEVEQDDMHRWYWKANNVVPDAVVVRRTPPPAPAQVPPPPCEEPVDVQTRPMDEPREVAALAEELAAIGREELEKYERVAVVPTAELEKPAPVEPTVKLRLTVPVSVARRILELVA
jgi:hypothetical protein